MLAILKNNYCRMLQRLSSILVMTVIMLLSIILAVYVTSSQQVKANIAVISENDITPVSSKQLSVTVMKNEPPYSDLVKHQYDAYVIDRGNGKYYIKTLKNQQFKSMVLMLLKNPHTVLPHQSTDRGVGVNIIGFLMMFLLMEAFMNMFTFADDKEKGQLSRIVTAPVSLTGYLAAHCIYCLSMFLPAYLMLIIMKVVGFNIGFTLLQYALLLLLIGMLGISFALMLNMFLKKPDNANMLGNSIIMLTSVLAGGFYSFSKDNKVLDYIAKILPQKHILDFAQYIQNGSSLTHLQPLFYVIGVSLLFFSVTCIKLRMQYVKKIC